MEPKNRTDVLELAYEYDVIVDDELVGVIRITAPLGFTFCSTAGCHEWLECYNYGDKMWAWDSIYYIIIGGIVECSTSCLSCNAITKG